jgi:hypothetical protein
MPIYPPPLDQLLWLGRPPDFELSWRDYRKLGLGQQHVSELIRMATDTQLNRGDSESREVWAPLHAWRALGQVGTEAAVEPLLELLSDDEDQDDWAHEELPHVFGMIGPVTIPSLAAFLVDASHGTWSRWAAADGLKEVALRHPQAWADCVAVLTRQLERGAEDDPELNGGIVAALLDLEAEESAAVIERAFAAGAVDESIAGDWPAVQDELGLSDDQGGHLGSWRTSHPLRGRFARA